MKYIAIIDTDDYKNFEFYEDGIGKYIHGIDAGAVNNEWIPLYFREYEQEHVLDKIRAEIDSLTWSRGGEDYFVNRKAVDYVLDKHIAEND